MAPHTQNRSRHSRLSRRHGRSALDPQRRGSSDPHGDMPIGSCFPLMPLQEELRAVARGNSKSGAGNRLGRRRGDRPHASGDAPDPETQQSFPRNAGADHPRRGALPNDHRPFENAK